MDVQTFALVAPLRGMVDCAVPSMIRHQPRRMFFVHDIIRQYMVCDGLQHGKLLALLHDRLLAAPAAAAKLNMSWRVLFNLTRLKEELTPGVLPMRVVHRFVNAVQCAPDTHHVLRRRVLHEVVQFLLSLPPASLSSIDCYSLWQIVVQCREADLCEALLQGLPLRETLELQSSESIADVLGGFCTRRRLSALPHSDAECEGRGSEEGKAVTSPPRQPPLLTTSWLRDTADNVRRLEGMVGVDVAWQHCAHRLQAEMDAAATRSRRISGRDSPLTNSSSVVTGEEDGDGEGARRAKAYEKLMSSCVLLSLVTRRWAATQSPAPLRSMNVYTMYALAQHLIALHSSLQGTPVATRSTSGSCVPAGVRDAVQAALDADMWTLTLNLPLGQLVQFYLVTLADLEAELGSVVALRRLLRDCFVRSLQDDRNELGSQQQSVKEGSTSSNSSSSSEHVNAADSARGERALRLFFTGAVLCATTTRMHAAAQRDLTLYLRRLLTSDVRRALRAASAATAEASELLSLWMYWSVLNTIYVLVALEAQLYKAGTFQAKTTSGSHDAALQELVELCRAVLTPTVLRQRGCARAVAWLLLYAPQLTQQLGLHETCVGLLQEHIMDGFTHRQLVELDGIAARLRPDASQTLHTVLQQGIQQLPQRLY